MTEYYAYCGACGSWSPSDEVSSLDHVMPSCPRCPAVTILVAHASVVPDVKQAIAGVMPGPLPAAAW